MDVVLSENVREYLRDLLNEMYADKNHSYRVEVATKKGDNYLGVIYRITLSSSAQTPFCLILKLPPLNLSRRKQFFARPCFLNEALAYNKFLPLVAQFQREQRVQPGDAFSAVAQCYRAITTPMHEAIILEDLHLRGYQLFDRFADIRVEHVRLVMRIYGRLHAVSLAIKQQCAAKLRTFQQIDDIFVQRKEETQFVAYFDELRKSALNTLDQQNNDDVKYAKRFVRYFGTGTFYDKLLGLIDGTQSEPYAVVCHGDCWNNNIMYKQEGDKVVDAALVDWQLMRYASPITDIMYFLFTCTTQQFRRQHFSEMLNFYYDELSKHLQRLGEQPESLFPRDAFDAEVPKFGAFGLLMVMIVMPLATLSSAEVPDLEELSEHIEAGGTTNLEKAGLLAQSNASLYTRLMRETIIDCVDYGYI